MAKLNGERKLYEARIEDLLRRQMETEKRHETELQEERERADHRLKEHECQYERRLQQEKDAFDGMAAVVQRLSAENAELRQKVSCFEMDRARATAEKYEAECRKYLEREKNEHMQKEAERIAAEIRRKESAGGGRKGAPAGRDRRRAASTGKAT